MEARDGLGGGGEGGGGIWPDSYPLHIRCTWSRTQTDKRNRPLIYLATSIT